MRNGLILALALLLLPISRGITHPFYVSVTELLLGPKQAELSVRLFTDDFETALRSEMGIGQVDLIKRQPKQIDSLVARYVRKHVAVQMNQQALVFQYVGFEQEEDATWVHLEAPLPANPHKLRLENELLLKHFTGQQNIVHVQFGKFKRTRRLNNDERVWELKLQSD